MTTELNESEGKECTADLKVQGGSSNAVYGLGMIGAWVYYLGRATTPEEKIRGFLKGLVWPAFLVYELFQFLHKE